MLLVCDAFWQLSWKISLAHQRRSTYSALVLLLFSGILAIPSLNLICMHTESCWIHLDRPKVPTKWPSSRVLCHSCMGFNHMFSHLPHNEILNEIWRCIYSYSIKKLCSSKLDNQIAVRASAFQFCCDCNQWWDYSPRIWCQILIPSRSQ